MSACGGNIRLLEVCQRQSLLPLCPEAQENLALMRRLVEQAEPVVSGGCGLPHSSCQPLVARRAPVLLWRLLERRGPKSDTTRKRTAGGGNKSVKEKFCFPSLLVHAFWFAGKLAAAAFTGTPSPDRV